MNFKVQVITVTEDGEESVREVANVERKDLTAASLGLSIDDSKPILQGIQEVVVEWQMNDYLDRIGFSFFRLPIPPCCGELDESRCL